MNKIGQIVTIVGLVCLVWFVVFFIRYGWDINGANIAMGTNGSILISAGLILMQLQKDQPQKKR